MATFLTLSREAFIQINAPLLFLDLIANIFYAYSLICPPRHGQRVKQPLKVLLAVLVSCSITYCVALTSLLITYYAETKNVELFFLWMVVLSFLHSSMTCSVWLNFFYFIQIVPLQRACLIWVKRNIKSVVYMTLLCSGALFFVRHALFFARAISPKPRGYPDNNGTLSGHSNSNLFLSDKILYIVIKVYVLICLCFMMVSSFSTVHYLHRHIRRVSHGSSCFSNQKIQSQMRVTITGIYQGVLYALFDTFNLLDTFSSYFSSQLFISTWITLTVTTLYITGTTLNLGIGQAVFRRRFVSIWRQIKALISGKK